MTMRQLLRNQDPGIERFRSTKIITKFTSQAKYANIRGSGQ